eukprot:1667751-Rhodomonas_salina.5
MVQKQNKTEQNRGQGTLGRGPLAISTRAQASGPDTNSRHPGLTPGVWCHRKFSSQGLRLKRSRLAKSRRVPDLPPVMRDLRDGCAAQP